jgi:hypothetical protein
MAKARAASEEKDSSKVLKKGTEQTKSQSVMNKHFDEALEFSHSGSDDSVDTKSAEKPKKANIGEAKNSNQITSSMQRNMGGQNVPQMESAPKKVAPAASSVSLIGWLLPPGCNYLVLLSEYSTEAIATASSHSGEAKGWRGGQWQRGRG